MPYVDERGIRCLTMRERAVSALLDLQDRLQGAAFRMVEQRNDEFEWRPTCEQADAVLTALQLSARQAGVIAEMVRDHCADGSSGPTERGIESIKEWCLDAMEGADGALDAMLCDILGAIEEYEHPDLARADTVRAVDREALLALVEEMLSISIEISSVDSIRPLEAAYLIQGYARRIREACGVKTDG